MHFHFICLICKKNKQRMLHFYEWCYIMLYNTFLLFLHVFTLIFKTFFCAIAPTISPFCATAAPRRCDLKCNYRKYEYPSQKLDMNGLSSCIYNLEIILISKFPSWTEIHFDHGGGEKPICFYSLFPQHLH